MESSVKPVIFKLGDQSYGIDINSVSSIEREPKVVSVPNSLDYIKGIINLRGEVIPVINLKRKFHLPDSQVSGENAIIVKMPGFSIAFEVDQVQEICNVEESDIINMPLIIKSGELNYLDKVINIEGNLVILINIQYLLNETEQDKVMKIAQDAV